MDVILSTYSLILYRPHIHHRSSRVQAGQVHTHLCGRACHPCVNHARKVSQSNLDWQLVWTCFSAWMWFFEMHPDVVSNNVLTELLYISMWLCDATCASVNKYAHAHICDFKPWIFYPRCVSVNNIQHGLPEQNSCLEGPWRVCTCGLVECVPH